MEITRVRILCPLPLVPFNTSAGDSRPAGVSQLRVEGNDPPPWAAARVGKRATRDRTPVTPVTALCRDMRERTTVPAQGPSASAHLCFPAKGALLSFPSNCTSLFQCSLFPYFRELYFLKPWGSDTVKHETDNCTSTRMITIPGSTSTASYFPPNSARVSMQ